MLKSACLHSIYSIPPSQGSSPLHGYHVMVGNLHNALEKIPWINWFFFYINFNSSHCSPNSQATYAIFGRLQKKRFFFFKLINWLINLFIYFKQALQISQFGQFWNCALRPMMCYLVYVMSYNCPFSLLIKFNTPQINAMKMNSINQFLYVYS